MNKRPPSTLPLLFLLLVLWGVVGHFDYQDERRLECSRKGGTYVSDTDTCAGLAPVQPPVRPANLSRASRASQAAAAASLAAESSNQ